MERLIKSIKTLAITAILVGSLTTCSNPFNWVAEVSDEVMMAKDLYLQVTGVTPVKNEPAFSQDDPILIEFDRDIDLANATDAAIVFMPDATWTSSFNTGTHTLTIIPDALVENTDYQVTINAGLHGTDGSALRDPYVWNFHAIPSPSGNVKINNDAKYTKSTTVTLNVTANAYVTHMRYAQSEVDLASAPYVPVAVAVNSYVLTGGEGTRTVYMQFRDSAVPTFHETNVKLDTVIQDTIAPAITLNNAPTVIGPSGWTSDVTVTETGSGVVTYGWSITTGGSLATISPTDQVNTTVTPTGEGSLRLRLLVTDDAGNTGSFYTSTAPYITIDLTPPAPPNITSGPGSTFAGSAPTYVWASTDGSGADYFRYRYDTTTSYSAETTALTASPTASYGYRSFFVQERDAAGNWSADSSPYYAWIYPSYLVPAQYATVDMTPKLVWATRVLRETTFNVYYKKSNSKFWSTFVEGTTAVSGTLPTLVAGSTYYWYFTAVSERTTRYPYGGDVFTFYTNSTP